MKRIRLLVLFLADTVMSVENFHALLKGDVTRIEDVKLYEGVKLRLQEYANAGYHFAYVATSPYKAENVAERGIKLLEKALFQDLLPDQKSQGGFVSGYLHHHFTYGGSSLAMDAPLPIVEYKLPTGCRVNWHRSAAVAADFRSGIHIKYFQYVKSIRSVDWRSFNHVIK